MEKVTCDTCRFFYKNLKYSNNGFIVGTLELCDHSTSRAEYAAKFFVNEWPSLTARRIQKEGLSKWSKK